MHRRRRVLILEDMPDQQELLTMLLSPTYDVIAASTVNEASQLVIKQGFDLAIVDNILPDGTGTAFCAALSKSHPQTFVVMYSADSRITSQQWIEAGARALIPKPHFEELQIIVEELLR
jgi:CheY-like chemotaxis protein